jgi:hypothetical protein
MTRGVHPEGKTGYSHQNLCFVDVELLCAKQFIGRSMVDLRSTLNLIHGESRFRFTFFVMNATKQALYTDALFA